VTGSSHIGDGLAGEVVQDINDEIHESFGEGLRVVIEILLIKALK
jgi:hypothetical protein